MDMELKMNPSLADEYKNASQKARVITEAWAENQIFCPRCGHPRLTPFKNNRPVADFHCSRCGNQFELKSKNGVSFSKISDGAYLTMIDRITGFDNPDFFFMTYLKPEWIVRNLFFVPKHFFTPDIIEKRAPLSSAAKRAGWEGCSILLSKVPLAGRIPLVENGVVRDKATVIKKVSAADALVVNNLPARGWLFDVLSCVEKIPRADFALRDVYRFEGALAAKHPDNRNIRAKIRQQLQMLRDRGFVEFTRPGEYRRLL